MRYPTSGALVQTPSHLGGVPSDLTVNVSAGHTQRSAHFVARPVSMRFKIQWEPLQHGMFGKSPLQLYLRPFAVL